MLQVRLQQYMSQELPDIQAGFRKGRGNKISNCQHPQDRRKKNGIPKKKKKINFCIINYAKAFDCVDHNKLYNILKEMEMLDHLTCLLRNLYARTRSNS